jgi:ABC-2 type transport system permease protein
MHSLVVVAAFARRALYEQTSRWTSVVLQLVAFGLGLLSQAFLGRLVDAAPNGQLGPYAGRYAAYLVIGIAVLDLQNAVVSGLSYKIREAQNSGSLEALLATPTPTALVLFAIVVPDLLWVLVRLVFYGAVGALLFGLRLEGMSLLGAAAVMVAAMAAFGALALVGATLTMVLRRSDPLSLLVASSSLIAGGVLYPRGILPRPLVLLGQALPITPALEAARAALVMGAGPVALAAPLGRLAAFALVGGAAGLWLFARALGRARAEGSLTSY